MPRGMQHPWPSRSEVLQDFAFPLSLLQEDSTHTGQDLKGPREQVTRWLRTSPGTPNLCCDSGLLLILSVLHREDPRGWEGTTASMEQMGTDEQKFPLPPASASFTTQLLTHPLPKALSSLPCPGLWASPLLSQSLGSRNQGLSRPSL